MIATIKSRYNTCPKVWDKEGIGLIDDLFLKSGNVHETDIAAEQSSYTIENTRDYCGNVQYQDGRLSRIMVDGGYCTAGGSFYAFVQDYRGSVRCVGYNNYTYYPDGKTKEYFDYQRNDPSQRYQFCGMERDEYNGLDLYDFHARWYDQELCQFTTMDPLCERYYDISPYAYCAGDPVNYIDPTGMVVWTTSDPDEIAKFVRQLKSTGQMSTEGMQVLEDEYTTAYYDAERGMLNLEYCHPLGVTLSDGFEDLVFKYTFTPAQTQLKQGDDASASSDDIDAWKNFRSNVGSGLFYAGTVVGSYSNGMENPYYWVNNSGRVFSKNLLKKQANGKYIKGYQGYKYGLNYTQKLLKPVRTFGNVVGAAGIAMTLYQGAKGDISPLEASVDTAFGIIGFCGFPGFVISTAYFGGKALYEGVSGKSLF